MKDYTKSLSTYSEYKPSSIEGLNHIPYDWGEKPLFSILKIQSVKNHAHKELLSVYLNRGVIKFSDVTEKRTNVTSLDLSNYQLVEINNFVMNNQQAWRGSVGVSPYEGIVSPAYLVLKISEDLNPRFANYMFRESVMVGQYLTSSKGVGTIQRNLYWPKLKRKRAALPSIPEQEKIANFLDDKTKKIERAIAIKEKQIELLKERKQILIQNAVTRGLNPDVPMKDSGIGWIGEIPAHWEQTKLGPSLKPVSIKNRPDLNLLSITRERGVIVRDIEDQESNHNFIPDDLTGYKLLEAGQFGMNKMKAWQGSYGVSPYTGIVSPAYFIFDLIADFNPDFFHLAIRSKLYVSFFASASDGVRIGQWDLSRKRMKAIPFAVPPKNEQVEIVKYVNKKLLKNANMITLTETQIQKLREYKASLINSAVTGKIKVPA